jgi:hypothetical protein
MNFISMAGSRDAEHEARKQRMGLAHLLRIDETKASNSADIMILRRVKAAAADKSDTYDSLLSERDVNRLFNTGAIYFQR